MTSIGGRPEAELLATAKREIIKKTTPSEVLSDEAEQKVTRFALSELTIGEELGRGGFCVVYDVTTIVQAAAEASAAPKNNGSGDFVQGIRRSFTKVFKGSKKSPSKSDGTAHDRGFMASNYTRGDVRADGSHDYRYAIKIIQSSARNSPESFVRSVMDLALETRYLAVLRHPNILRMRAMASTSPYEEGKPFFIVLDKLSVILPARLKAWKKRFPSALVSCCFPKEKKEFWVERLMVAFDLSSALAYMHSQGICYRDVKPDNIGFDWLGDVMIFDFGLAREMQQKLLTTEGTYQMTGMTGFPPYMAPEVALEKPYNETCDVYSFTMLLWQILKLETPFGEKLTDEQFQAEIVEGGARPKLDKPWPAKLKSCMANSWGEDITQRPAMEDVSKVLHSVILEETGTEREGLLTMSRLRSGKYV